MAGPNPQALEDGLVAAVRELFSGPDREQLSVNTVRRRVEDGFGLEEGFFAGAQWKARSKQIIKDAVVRFAPLLLHPAPFVLLR